MPMFRLGATLFWFPNSDLAAAPGVENSVSFGRFKDAASAVASFSAALVAIYSEPRRLREAPNLQDKEARRRRCPNRSGSTNCATSRYAARSPGPIGH